MPGSFQNPIGGNKPSDPYDYRVEEIQKDKEERETPPEPPKRPFLLALIIQACKKFLELFEKEEEQALSYSEADARAHLLEIRALFESLQTEDHSQDASFLQQLSLVWVLLLDDVLQFPRRSPLVVEMQGLIELIQGYPEGREHSLGYYLSEYAGQKWLPFPYMEIVQSLWAEHQKQGEEGHLVQWCRKLDEILESLDKS